MSKLLLKNALDSLQVKNPLRLPSAAPMFRVPAITQGVIPSQDSILSKDTNPSQDRMVSRDQIASPDLNISPDLNQSLGEKSSVDLKEPKGIIESLDEKISQDRISPQVARSTQPRRATIQDEAVVEADSARAKLSTGYTRIPNSVLMDLVSGDLSRNEMKLMLLIARMTISFNRALVPLSKGVIERMTGIQGRAVLEATQSLEKAGVIQKIPGDHNHPNRMGLVFDSACFKTQGENPSQDVTITQDQKRPLDELASCAKGEIQPQGWGENSPYIKDNNKYKNNNSLSETSGHLRKYFETLKPEKKRESEMQAFFKLKAEYTESDISDCLELILSRGVTGPDGKTEPCHSPMAFLSKAIGSVLREVRSQREKTRNREVAAVQRAQILREQEEAEGRESAEWAEMERTFCEAYPDVEKQDVVVAKLCVGLPWKPNSRAGRVFAIRRWADEERKLGV